MLLVPRGLGTSTANVVQTNLRRRPWLASRNVPAAGRCDKPHSGPRTSGCMASHCLANLAAGNRRAALPPDRVLRQAVERKLPVGACAELQLDACVQSDTEAVGKARDTITAVNATQSIFEAHGEWTGFGKTTAGTSSLESGPYEPGSGCQRGWSHCPVPAADLGSVAEVGPDPAAIGAGVSTGVGDSSAGRAPQAPSSCTPPRGRHGCGPSAALWPSKPAAEQAQTLRRENTRRHSFRRAPAPAGGDEGLREDGSPRGPSDHWILK